MRFNFTRSVTHLNDIRTQVASNKNYRYSYYVELKRGDLVRWVTDHSIYEATGDVLVGVSPNYRHGIIMEVSKMDPNHVMVMCYDCKKRKEGNWMILDMVHDRFEVLSGGSDG